jgi:nucleoside-diphosphate-sugar epimerase
MSLAALNPDQFDCCVVGRRSSLFAADIAANRERIADALKGRRVLVVGGGGSIGSATIRQLLRYAPSAIHVIDHSENYLADLVRDIRSHSAVSPDIDLRTWPIDFGNRIAERLIRAEAPYDIVMNFAALKHVRSEKDIHSLLQMLDTNVVRQARFKEWIVARGGASRFFGVSTDKAANPTSLMGATKRLMEDVLFGIAPDPGITVTSARFANVLFSNGSLPQSWLRRIELGQPLAVPRDTRRYFVTREESGEICLLAATAGLQGEILIPRLNPERELQPLELIVSKILGQLGFEPEHFADENEARRSVEKLRRERRWPVLLTPLDTSGEKPYEEFVGKGERSHDIGMVALQAIQRLEPRVDARFISGLETLIHSADGAAKADIVAALAGVVPNLSHIDTGKNLDQRM